MLEFVAAESAAVEAGFEAAVEVYLEAAALTGHSKHYHQAGVDFEDWRQDSTAPCPRLLATFRLSLYSSRHLPADKAESRWC